MAATLRGDASVYYPEQSSLSLVRVTRVKYFHKVVAGLDLGSHETTLRHSATPPQSLPDFVLARCGVEMVICLGSAGPRSLNVYYQKTMRGRQRHRSKSNVSCLD